MTTGKGDRAICCSWAFVVILVLFDVSQSSAGLALSTRGEQAGEQETRLEMVPSTGPPESLKSRMRCWSCQTEDARSSFRNSWTGVALAIERGNQARVEALCRRLRDDVEALQSSFLDPAPDPITWFYLSRGLGLIRKATVDCSRRRIFALSYGLSRARRMFRQVDRRLEALGCNSCSLQGSSAPICRD